MLHEQICEVKCLIVEVIQK